MYDDEAESDDERADARVRNVLEDFSNQLIESQTKFTDRSGQMSADAKKHRRQSHKKCKAIVTNPRNELIELRDVGRGKQWWVQERDGVYKPYVGLTTRLNELFYNEAEYDYRTDEAVAAEDSSTQKHLDAQGNAKDAIGSNVRPPKVDDVAGVQNDLRDIAGDHHLSAPGGRQKTVLQRRNQCKCTGIKHGRIVHEEIARFVFCWIQDRNVRSFFESNGEPPDVCTVAIIEYLVKHNWIPMYAEYPIFDRQLRTATAVDLVVWDMNSGDVYFIEIKTGYPGAKGTPTSFVQPAGSEPYLRGVLGKWLIDPQSGSIQKYPKEWYNPTTRQVEDHPEANKRIPGKRIRDCGYQRASLQSMVTLCMYTEGVRYDSGSSASVVLPERFYVMHVNPETVHVTCDHLANWCFDPQVRKLVYDSIMELDKAQRASSQKPAHSDVVGQDLEAVRKRKREQSAVDARRRAVRTREQLQQEFPDL